ncbi:MAG: SpoIID/LytB domain-containing protein [Clostridia bacterium]|nr:SpoIID/LytB domain-containing protein [Clostridia bacterium]
MKASKKGGRRIVLLSALFAVLVSFIVVAIISASSASEATYDETVKYVRVGLKHSSDVVDEYTFSTSYGVEYGIQTKTDDVFTPLGSYKAKKFVARKTMGFYSIAVYAYEKDNGTRVTQRQELKNEVELLMKGDEVSFFEHFSGDGGCEIRLGSFVSKQEAEDYLLRLAVKLEGTLETRIIYEDKSTVYLFDESGNAVVGFTGTDAEHALCVRPLVNEGETVYLKAGSLEYEGMLEFRRYEKNTVDGISVINVMPTDRYIACVMSYEISPSSAHEVQKAFSIAVRNYTYHGIDKHKSVNFDLCCDTHCQAYRGSDRLNTNVITAAEETTGLVIYGADGKLAEIFYSSTAGGATVAIEDTWNTSAVAHLGAFPTPWERYRNYNSYTKWTREYTPAELYNRVKDDCPNLKGNIADVKITLCEDSPHVYKITYTDIYGNTDSVTRTTTLRVMLGLNSGCFVVGKAGETVKRTVYSYDCFDNVYAPDYEGPLAIKLEADVLENIGSTLEDEDIEVLKQYIVDKYGSDSKYLNGTFDISSTGTIRVKYKEESVHFTESGLPDLFCAVPVVKEYDVKLEGTKGSFVFDGMGWGHGVGLSQNGAKELVKLGYDYKTVLEVYFPGATVEHVK